jgi:hypothetical protein
MHYEKAPRFQKVEAVMGGVTAMLNRVRKEPQKDIGNWAREWDRVRPGDERFKNLPDGVKRGGRTDRICHHTSDRQYRRHAVNRAQKRQRRVGLSCRTRSLTNLAKLKAHDKFLGTSNPAEDAVPAVNVNGPATIFCLRNLRYFPYKAPLRWRCLELSQKPGTNL